MARLLKMSTYLVRQVIIVPGTVLVGRSYRVIMLVL